jgi:cytochrome P450 PksS
VLPTTVIAEVLGILTSDCHHFRRWSISLLSATPNALGMTEALPRGLSFLLYIRKLTHSRQDRPQNGLSSVLVQAQESGEQLSEDELLSMIFLLLIAGHETTVSLMGNGILSLLEHPETLDRLRNTLNSLA